MTQVVDCHTKPSWIIISTIKSEVNRSKIVNLCDCIGSFKLPETVRWLCKHDFQAESVNSKIIQSGPF